MSGIRGKVTKDSESPAESVWLGKLEVAGKTVDIAGFDAGPLQGLVKIPHGSLGMWDPKTRSGPASF